MDTLRPPPDLALPRAGSGTLRRVLGLVLKETVRDLFRISAEGFERAAWDDFVRVRAILETLLRSGTPGLVFALVRRPTASALIRCIRAELRRGNDGDSDKLNLWLAELSAQLAYGLARNHALPGDGIELRQVPSRILCPDADMEVAFETSGLHGPLRFFPGVLAFDESASIRCELLEQSAESDTKLPTGISSRRAYRSVTNTIRLALTDNNPLSEFEAHPEKDGNALSLGGKSEDAWLDSLRRALTIIDEATPELGAEFPLIVQTIVPVGFEPEKHLSASYAEAIGTIYLSLHPNPLTMAEALVHEYSHNKLNALFALDPLLDNGFQPLFRSPVRPDPRPLHGLLLAAHAFLPVATLFERLRDTRHPLARERAFESRFTEIRARNDDAITTLREHAKPTPVGRAILEELYEINDRFRDKEPDAAPAPA